MGGEIKQSILLRLVSDHHLALLELGVCQGGPSPFRFENAQLRAAGVKEMMKICWGFVKVQGNYSCRLHIDLTNFKLILKTWNKEVFEEIKEKKRRF